MKNKYILLLVLLSAFLISPSKIFSQEAKLTERWVCLNAKQCIDKEAGCSKVNGHRAKLTIKPDKPPLSTKETYVVVCLSTKSGTVCTTGSGATDQIVYGRDVVSEINKSINYNFEGFFESNGKTKSTNPIAAGQQFGTHEWQDSTPAGTDRKFLALNYVEPTGKGAEGNEGGQQQGTFTFEDEFNNSNCAAINWDPYGRVFSSQTLEPIYGAQIELQVKRDNGLFTKLLPEEILGGTVINPFLTKENGAFSFVVPDGTYKLLVNNYPITSSLNNIHSNYSKIYSDIYPLTTGAEIIQKGEIQHRDIPVDFTSSINIPTQTQYFYELNKITRQLIVDGTTSFPFTKITLFSVKLDPDTQNESRYKQITSINTDKNGRFKVSVDTTKFEPTEYFGSIDFEKIPLTGTLSQEKNNFLKDLFSRLLKIVGKEAQAQTQQTTTLKFEPIPNYLEGYAYDLSGKPMSNVTVGIYLTFSNKPYYETKANNEGYYKVTSEFLPTLPYVIRYTTPLGLIVNTKPSVFIAQNTKTIAEKKINLNSYKDKNGATLPASSSLTNQPSTSASGFAQNKVGVFETDKANQQPGTTTVNQKPALTKTSSLITIVILLLLMLGLLGGIGFYLYKKKQQQVNL